MRAPLSLKARAVALLAQREHSAPELRRKLLRIAREREKETGKAPAAADAETEADHTPADPTEEVNALLTWLQTQGYLDETRFVESRINARASRFGTMRIAQELSRHGLALDAEQQATLKSGELERARAVWQRKFGGKASSAPIDDPARAAAERARQARFLASRGFSGEVVRRVVRGLDTDD